MQTLEERVNKPKHYRSHPSGIETIEITRYLDCDSANAWKYSMRYLDKNTPKEDLLKAIFYINDFVKYFTDGSGDVTISNKIPAEVVEKMIKVAESETTTEVQAIFNDIISMTVAHEIDLFKLTADISNLEKYAKTFEG